MLDLDRWRQGVSTGRKSASAGTAAAAADRWAAVKDVRYFTAPRSAGGVIEGVGRLADGSGDASVTMWDRDGTVPTVLVGPAGSGKSQAVKVLACGALFGGMLNLLFADPHGRRCMALARRARVAIIGRDDVSRLPSLVCALVENRMAMRAELGPELVPSERLPGWMVLHENYSLVSGANAVATGWRRVLDVVLAASVGVWPVAATQPLSYPHWHSTIVGRRWSRQVVAFGGMPGRGDVSDDAVRWPAGAATHTGLDTPVRWDYLASAAAAQRIVEAGGVAPALTDELAFERFFNVPDVHAGDVEVLERFLGRAVNGRWQVGGYGATHEFRM